MISSLRGTVLSASGGTAVVEVGGVGFAVQLTPDHVLSLRVGDEAFVHTSLIVREDALQLFGFADREQLEVFELLTGVSGVGPKSAIGVLSVLAPDDIAAAVAADDDAPFRKVSGIGPKTAKLIVVSLAGKLAAVRRPAPRREVRRRALVGHRQRARRPRRPRLARAHRVRGGRRRGRRHRRDASATASRRCSASPWRGSGPAARRRRAR